MKKVFLSLIGFASLYSLSAAPLSLDFTKGQVSINGECKIEISSVKTNNSFTEISAENCVLTGAVGEPQLPVFTQLVALPENGNFTLTSNNLQYEEISLSKPLIYSGVEDVKKGNTETYAKNEWYPKEAVKVGRPVIMAGNRFSQLAFYPVQYNPVTNKIRVTKNVKLDFNLDLSVNDNPLKSGKSNNPSPAFNNLLAGVSGFEPVKSSPASMRYLIIAPTGYETSLNYLVKWKRQLGFATKLLTVGNDITNTQLKALIQAEYDNLSTRPDFVVLVGDVDGAIKLPSNFVPASFPYGPDYDVTDHTYTLLEGDDYFPDVLIGRLSVRNVNELNTVISKIIKYEREPYTGINWFKKALMLSTVWDIPTYQFHFFSGKETVLAVKDKLMNYGYQDVDVYIEPEQNGGIGYIQSQINNGCSFVNYRGQGTPEYWYGAPTINSISQMFNIQNINQLNNGYMLPMVTSIVCGGGMFDTAQYPSCFGETWLTAGTASQPKGAIGFIGPSETDTKTLFNNTNDLGLYQGVTREGAFRCAEMMLRGKMELYNCFPDCHTMGNAMNSDQFYFFVYNLLGDPGLNVWTDTPKNCDFTSSSLAANDNFIDVNLDPAITDKSGFTVAVLTGDSLVTTGLTDSNGRVFLSINPKNSTYEITIAKYGYIPKTKTVTVTGEQIVGLSSFAFSAPTESGKNISVLSVIKNLTSANLNNLVCRLESSNELLTVSADSVVVPTLSAQAEQNITLNFSINNQWQNGAEPELYLRVKSDNGVKRFLLPFQVKTPDITLIGMTVSNADNALLTGENNFKVKLLNSGKVNADAFQIRLSSLTSGMQVVDSTAMISPLAVNSETISSTFFKVNLASSIIAGEAVEFKYTILQNEQIVQTGVYSTSAGVVKPESPTVSNYGYLAIESRDTHTLAPLYNWIEITEGSGGAGYQVYPNHSTIDGFNKRMQLPFTFKYFGNTYNNVVIASNGTVSFGEKNLIFYSNKTIPSGNGPDAMVAPFWDALKDGTVHYYFDEENHRFIVTWQEMKSAYNPALQNTFQVVLYDQAFHPSVSGNGDILFQYKEVHNVDVDDNFATIGIENGDKTDGLLLSYANHNAASMHELQNETAILFTTLRETGIANEELGIRNEELFQNYPNPFNNSTVVSYQLAQVDLVKLSVYNVKGELVKNLVNATQTAGKHSVTFKADGLNSGVYYIKMQSGKFNSVQKCLLVK